MYKGEPNYINFYDRWSALNWDKLPYKIAIDREQRGTERNVRILFEVIVQVKKLLVTGSRFFKSIKSINNMFAWAKGLVDGAGTLIAPTQ